MFASKREAARYLELKILLKAGLITRLELQPKYPLVISGVRVAMYIADFQYVQAGKVVIEDVKGAKTAVYQLKKKIMNALYGIEVKEI